MHGDTEFLKTAWEAVNGTHLTEVDRIFKGRVEDNAGKIDWCQIMKVLAHVALRNGQCYYSGPINKDKESGKGVL